ncbi:hypothetical protein PSC67_11420 [Fusobacterium nucleatum]|nr:hypothetical protein [Fusobacterium nucleatum]WDF24620.1 hypothetical protein PSC67_11420 [Fusobacterium nucleatum]
MKELYYKEARELILQGKKVSRNFLTRVYFYFKDGELVREEKVTKKIIYVREVYKNGIKDLDEIFKDKEEHPSYKFVEVN